MSNEKKGNILFIKDKDSALNTDTKMFDVLFTKADIAFSTGEALEHMDDNAYDVIVNDMSVDAVGGLKLLKHIIQMRPKTLTLVILSPKDEDQIPKLMTLEINAFVLEPDQLDEALEAIANMTPSLKEKK